jgi:hypothetical protein
MVRDFEMEPKFESNFSIFRLKSSCISRSLRLQCFTIFFPFQVLAFSIRSAGTSSLMQYTTSYIFSIFYVER